MACKTMMVVKRVRAFCELLCGICNINVAGALRPCLCRAGRGLWD